MRWTLGSSVFFLSLKYKYARAKRTNMTLTMIMRYTNKRMMGYDIFGREKIDVNFCLYDFDINKNG